MTADLYTLNDVETGGSAFTARVSFNKKHPVFAGHFPGKPIVPGVFLLEILRDAVSMALNKNCGVAGAGSIKYLSVIDPTVHPEIRLSGTVVEAEPGKIKIDATFGSSELIFAKFKGLRLEA